MSLLKRVDHEWCSALVDTGKYMTEDPYVDIALMAPYAVNWQIKETLFMKRPGYDSYIEVPKMLAELNHAINASASITPEN